MTKRSLYIIYIMVICCLASATIVEKLGGYHLAHSFIYDTWWFVGLWAALAFSSILHILKQKLSQRSLSFYMIHSSLLLILIGALVTRTTSQSSTLHLRVGEFVNAYIDEQVPTNLNICHLPFSIRLDSFKIVYYAGSHTPADYHSWVTISDKGSIRNELISMNHILNSHSYRLYQSSYDEDLKGSIFLVSYDPWGTTLTYIAYILFFLSMLLLLVEPKSAFRTLLRHPLLQKGFILFALFFLATPLEAKLPATLPAKEAQQMGNLYILYNGRICPFSFLAQDFTQKLYGKHTYKGLSPEQVALGWMFWANEWSREPFIKVSSNLLRNKMSWGKYISLDNLTSLGNLNSPPDNSSSADLFTQQYLEGSRDKLRKELAEIEAKAEIAMQLREGILFKCFPTTVDEGNIVWLSVPEALEANPTQAVFADSALQKLRKYAISHEFAHFSFTIRTIADYQSLHGANTLPSPIVVKTEKFYRSIPFTTILFIFNLTLGFLSLLLFFRRILTRLSEDRIDSFAFKLHRILFILSFVLLTFVLILRWIVSGTIPMSNGYETMLSMAWFVMIITRTMFHRFRIMLSFGFLLSGFFLLVSHISQMDPQIAQLMPVLNSPLLSIHVSTLMIAYALLSLTFICAITAIIIYFVSNNAEQRKQQTELLSLLSRLLLYPALSLLGIGIFLGAIWANISWGSYWSWDPKETWALITFLIYAIAVHPSIISHFRRPMPYHVFIILAFTALLMTYFGVNYLLGGMHSYA